MRAYQCTMVEGVLSYLRSPNPKARYLDVGPVTLDIIDLFGYVVLVDYRLKYFILLSCHRDN